MRVAIVLSFCVFAAGAVNSFGQNITSFSPNFGKAGSQVDIYGSGFTSSVRIWFGATRANATWVDTSDMGDHIIAYVPSGLSGAVQIGIGNGTASPTLWTDDYFTNITSAPYIVNFTPETGSAGTSVKINGANFTGISGVYFNTNKSTSVSVVQDNQITAKVPTGATTGYITVMSSKGNATSQGLFYVSPSIASFTPTSARVGESIVISGANFLGATAVRFAGVTASFDVDSNSQITAQIPSGVTNGTISVSVGGSAAVSSAKFSVLPTVIGFTPKAGAAGTVVTISGTALNVGKPTVTFGGISTVSPSDITYYQLLVVVPSTAVSGPIKVTTGNGTFVTTDNFLMPPTITGFSTNQAFWGAPVFIYGKNFTNATMVQFSGVTNTFIVVDNETISTTVPFGASSGWVTVTSAAGSTNSPLKFLVRSSLSGVRPAAAAPGATVSFNGVFPDAATSITFNGVAAKTFSSTTNIITATVPALASTGPVIIKTAVGSMTNSSPFYVLPLISGFTPTSGPPGTLVTVTGTFNDLVTNVLFNGVEGTITASSNAVVKAVVPNGATPGPITVISLGGSASSAESFSMPNYIASANPSVGMPGLQISIKGWFPGLTNAAFNGLSAEVVSATSNLVVALVPTNASAGPISLSGSNMSCQSSFNFLILPQVTDFTPDSGSAGTSVTIRGAFPDALTNVSFNSVDAVFTQTDASHVIAIVPTNATTGPVTVSSSVGSGSSTNEFTVAYAISIRASNSIAQISWLTNAVGYSLQYRTNLKDSPWFPNAEPQVIGGFNVATNAITNQERYYRLIK
jgi:hypothetical protein